MEFDVHQARETRNYLRQQQGEGAVYAAYEQRSILTKDNITCFKDAGAAMDFYFKNFSMDKVYGCGKIRQMIQKVEDLLRREAKLKNGMDAPKNLSNERSKYSPAIRRCRR
jgi:tRNA isopentenyl-2-thiomethyl-A-37 hydroxylase MiaE